MSDEYAGLAAFLLEAKRRTYAGLDDDATIAVPQLAGSKQLEHRAGPYSYRDIYFGMGFFVGQETVSMGDRPIWSMAYSGGALADVSGRDALLSLYRFLRQALLVGDVNLPYRGPAVLEGEGMTYRNDVNGTLTRFQGVERIFLRNTLIYELHYSGGLLR